MVVVVDRGVVVAVDTGVVVTVVGAVVVMSPEPFEHAASASTAQTQRLIYLNALR
jgi:hypothetical protein